MMQVDIAGRLLTATPSVFKQTALSMFCVLLGTSGTTRDHTMSRRYAVQSALLSSRGTQRQSALWY